MARESRKDEIEKLEREVADLQRLARPDIPSADLERASRRSRRNCATIFTSTWAPGSARFWRAIRSVPT